MYLTLISELYSKIGKPVGYALIWPTMKRLCAAEQSMASYGFLALNRVQLYYSASWTVYVFGPKGFKRMWRLAISGLHLWYQKFYSMDELHSKISKFCITYSLNNYGRNTFKDLCLMEIKFINYIQPDTLTFTEHILVEQILRNFPSSFKVLE